MWAGKDRNAFISLLDILQLINCRSYLAFLVIYEYMFLYIVSVCVYTLDYFDFMSILFLFDREWQQMDF